MKRRTFLRLLTTPLLLSAAAIGSSPKPDFSGTWKQSNARCVPERTGDVSRRITQRGAELVVETTVSRSIGPSRHAVQRYSLDGGTSVSTGTDGDEFHTSIAWQGDSLVLTVEEHEDGRVLHSRETWTLIENKSALQVNREHLDAPGAGVKKQTLVYLRDSPDAVTR